MAETGTVRIGRPKQLLLISFSIFHAPEIAGPSTERIFEVLTNPHHMLVMAYIASRILVIGNDTSKGSPFAIPYHEEWSCEVVRKGKVVM